MRNFLSLVLSFFIIMAAVPAVSLFYKDEILTTGQSTALTSTEHTKEEEAATQNKKESTASVAASADVPDKVYIFLHEENKVIPCDTRFYLISVLAKEIDIHAPTEALKAQAVCIYTFLLHTKEQLSDQSYDISDDPACHQQFLTKKKLEHFWGEDYEKNYQLLEEIVDSVYGQYLTQNAKPILAAYHSSNAGKTESAENYWGEGYDYLVPVTSIGDTLCDTYKNEISFTPDAFKEALETIKGKSFSFPESPSDWLGEIQTTPSQTVVNMQIAGAAISGRELREALGLKSSFFTLIYKDGAFLFTVSGFGHGVGLSQEGAKYMARLGFSYRDILLHYYNGVAIKGENKV